MKTQRNAMCPCGSGNKFKKCCAVIHVQPTRDVPPSALKQLAATVDARLFAELEAQCRDLLAAYPASGLVTKVLALALWEQGKDAMAYLRRVTAMLPDDAEAHSNLGNALRVAGQLDAAVRSHRRALEIDPRYAEAHNNLGSALLDMGLLEAATDSFRQAVVLRPDFALAHCNLANVLVLQNEIEAAEASCRRALQLNPALTGAIVQLAEITAARGQFEIAMKWLEAAISYDPDMPEAWAGLVRWRKVSAGDIGWLSNAQRVSRLPLPPRRKIPLQFALGKYFDDIADYEQAFDHYRHANELAKASRPAYDRQGVSRAVDEMIEIHNRSWLHRVRGPTNRDERAVFVIGMPRSGTTLAEQILAAHPQVYGAGELPFWSTRAPRHAMSNPATEDERHALEVLAREYSGAVRRIAPDARRVVDKMPQNFLHLGLIHAALPSARIIHLRRHPVDTCLSVFFQHFSAGHAYSSDLDDLVHYYGQYLRIMRHWRDTISADVLLEVPYEGLVSGPEPWSRRMVEFIGLPWDPICLEFHHNARPVNTLSKWQARQPIGTTSVARWRHYERFLGPLLALADVEPAAARS